MLLRGRLSSFIVVFGIAKCASTMRPCASLTKVSAMDFVCPERNAATRKLCCAWISGDFLRQRMTVRALVEGGCVTAVDICW